MGFETVHPEIAATKQKFSLGLKGGGFLQTAGIAVRAFILVNPPS
jgi:hypothetical protein